MIFWSVIIVFIGIVSFFIPVNDRGIPAVVMSSAPFLLLIPAVESWLFARKL